MSLSAASLVALLLPLLLRPARALPLPLSAARALPLPLSAARALPLPPSAAPLDVLRSTISAMLLQSPQNSSFFQYNYGPGYALAALYEAAALRPDLNFSTRASAVLDEYLQPGGYAYNVSRGVLMPYTGAVGEPTSMALAYAVRARDATDAAVAVGTADTYMLAYPYTLPHGVFVRPGGWGAQPGHAFLWGDDQYMGLALLCRLARGGAPRAAEYLSTAVANALTNAQRAQQPGGLFPHGFNTLNNESSCCLWGRANGWIAMSLVELLWALPPREQPQQQQLLQQLLQRDVPVPARAAVLAVFARMANGLVRAQDAADGRWHQVLDEPDTFLETSATAMFTFALATGVVEGWLPRAQYEAPVRAAWAGLLRAVREDGTVDGICQGTPVELDVAAYNSRTTFYNESDPGLGAVFRAAMAMERFNAQAVVPRRRVNWYLSSSETANNAALIALHGDAITGAYLCCGFGGIAANGSWASQTTARALSEMAPITAAAREVWEVSGVAEAAVHSGAWRAGGLDAAAAALAPLAAAGLRGIIVDYEPASNYTVQHAAAYGMYLGALAAALAPLGLAVGADIASWGILGPKFWPQYVGRGLVTLTSMTPTYNADNITENHVFVTQALQGLPAGSFEAGMGTVLGGGPCPMVFGWTNATLAPFVRWMGEQGVASLAVWRCDIDRGYPAPDPTAPWFFDALAQFLSPAL